MQIETERLLLVPVSEQHTGEVYQHFNEKVIVYMFPGVLKDNREAERNRRVYWFGRPAPYGPDHFGAGDLDKNGFPWQPLRQGSDWRPDQACRRAGKEKAALSS